MRHKGVNSLFMRKVKDVSRLLKVLYLSVLIQIMVCNWSGAEEFVDVKYMHYQEDGGRMRIMAPSFLYKKEYTPDFSIQIDGIYNSISGATPTGAPPVPRYETRTIIEQVPVAGVPSQNNVTAVTNERNDDDDEEDDDDRRIGFNGRAAATPAAQPVAAAPTAATPTATSSPSQSTSRTTTVPAGTTIPKKNVTDTRVGFNANITRSISKSHTLSATGSFSTEKDYLSTGLALLDSMKMNSKNTVLSFGGAYTYDTIDITAESRKENKASIDALIGWTQYINPKTIFNLNLVAGTINGYITDQYKVVELNGELVGENRPDTKNKLIAYTGLTRRVDALDGTAEGSYRFYNDSFGINSHTITLAWFQNINKSLILRPVFRIYQQSEADFYDVRFTGTPDYYSSDYRVSALSSASYGLKLIWVISDRFRVDAAYDRYEMDSTDGKTDAGMYPAANVITIGGRLCF